jgi:hypothetical protein
MRRTLLLLAIVGCDGASADVSVATPPAAPPPAPSLSRSPALSPAPSPSPAPSLPGADFTADAQLLYRIAACGGNAPLPRDDQQLVKIVDRHCKAILDRMDKFRAMYFDKGRAWFDAVVPSDTKTVVYPFGGGDLISALVAFPDATEITTISLELAGDPRRLRTLDDAGIERSLGSLRVEIGGLISVGSNTSENLSAGQRNDLPGQVSSFLLGLVAGGYEPVTMRYFTLDDAGNIHYLEQAEIDEADQDAAAHRPKGLKGDWQSPAFSTAFANVEIQYRKLGETQLRVHRHIGWNLGNTYLKTHPQLVRHLESKGRVVMLTKGASYLLWRPDFSTIRTYMLDHLSWMLSDSTGIPPAYAKSAGMVQETYGYYHGAFLEGAQTSKHDEAFIELWKTQPRRRLDFRFGYVDKDKQAHLLVTRPRT